MLGLKKENDHYIFEAAVRTEQLFLNLYHKNRRVRQIAFDPADRIGDVWHLELPVTSALPLAELSYCYEAEAASSPIRTGRYLRDGRASEI